MTVSTIDYQHFLSESSKDRKPSAIRRLIPLTKIPGMISFGAGAPNGDLFPFEGISISLKNGQSLQIDSQVLNESMTYGPSDGLPQLNGWLKELQKIQHAPPKDFVVSIGTGSQDLVTKALQMLISPGDNVLFESPGYVGVIAFLRHQPCNLIDVELDSHGVVPAKLREQLDNWPSDKRKPKMLYTVPVGGNPTGYGDKIPSYLSMDVDGRVLRFDSMSKILSSGLRVGWATGPAELVNVMNLVTMDSFDLIMTKATEKKVLLVPGIEFFCHPTEVGPVQFVRASFSNVSEEDMDAGLERLGSLLRDHIAESKSSNSNTIDKK
ncbi:hypothetical protein BGZ91_006345 [Linnemannia elongata]|nr:hypothetical protein BGZ91_006345 [Linnemannia elongata]